jgi:hypothetical protein
VNAPFIVEEVMETLRRRFGPEQRMGKSRLFHFGSSVACSVNYSKQLQGSKFFFGLARDVVDPDFGYPTTELGSFVLLVCGSSNKTLVLPRSMVLEVMAGVTTRRLDVFVENGAYVLQTTGHPKRIVTDYLNAYPRPSRANPDVDETSEPNPTVNREHVKVQWALIELGRAEGCAVWVPPNDRNLSFQGRSFAERTVDQLPNFGFEENTRRVVQNIDVLWLTRNVIAKAFEIEASTMVYSGLLRLNDLILSQPNNQIDLYVAAASTRRERVRAQLMRPSFQPLLPRCQYVTFETIEDQIQRIAGFPVDQGARITGLVRGERFTLPDHYAYPPDL